MERIAFVHGGVQRGKHASAVHGWGEGGKGRSGGHQTGNCSVDHLYPISRPGVGDLRKQE